MFRACELKDQTYKKTRTLDFSELTPLSGFFVLSWHMSTPEIESSCCLRNLWVEVGSERLRGRHQDRIQTLQSILGHIKWVDVCFKLPGGLFGIGQQGKGNKLLVCHGSTSWLVGQLMGHHQMPSSSCWLAEWLSEQCSRLVGRLWSLVSLNSWKI